MTEQLAGKVAAVTGATSGSGLAIARRFIQEGATVFMLARGEERLEVKASELGAGAVPLVTDVADSDSVRASFAAIEDRAGSLDILINNAAIYRPCPVEKLSDEDITRQVNTNLLGPIHTCRAAIPLMRAAGAGDIVNTSSESTRHPFPWLSLYVSTKAGLEMFTQVLGSELSDDGIRVTNFVQGATEGEIDGSTDWEWDPELGLAAHELWTERGLLAEVMGRSGFQHVDDVADTHLFIVTRPRSQKLDTVWCRSN